MDGGKGHPAKSFKKSDKLNGKRYAANEHAVAVEWFERDASDEEDRTFFPGCAGVEFFNSSELRAIRVNMVQTVEVRELRHGGQGATRERRQRAGAVGVACY